MSERNKFNEKNWKSKFKFFQLDTRETEPVRELNSQVEPSIAKILNNFSIREKTEEVLNESSTN